MRVAPLAFGCYAAGTLKGGQGNGVSISPQAGRRFSNKRFWGWSDSGASLSGEIGIGDFFESVSVLVMHDLGSLDFAPRR